MVRLRLRLRLRLRVSHRVRVRLVEKMRLWAAGHEAASWTEGEA